MGSLPNTDKLPAITPPEKWGTNPLTQRSKVDFPLPEGPETSVSVFGGMLRLTD